MHQKGLMKMVDKDGKKPLKGWLEKEGKDIDAGMSRITSTEDPNEPLGAIYERSHS